MSEDIFESIAGKIVYICSLCHHETREFDIEENHAFDCDNRRLNNGKGKTS